MSPSPSGRNAAAGGGALSADEELAWQVHAELNAEGGEGPPPPPPAATNAAKRRRRRSPKQETLDAALPLHAARAVQLRNAPHLPTL